MQNSHYETHNIAKELLPFIFHHDEYVMQDAEFINWHENIEIIQHIKGEGYAFIDSVKYEMKNSNILVINSNALHAFGTDHSVAYDCLIIDKRFFDENGIDINKMKFSTEISSPSLSSLYLDAARLIDSFRESPDELDVPRIRAALLAFALELCENHRTDEETDRHYSTDRIKDIITYINNNVTSPLTLDEISKQAKMSKYYLCREFKAMTGTTLFEYINIARCREAKHRLKNGASVSEAAGAVGFESLSYFTKKFKHVTGKLPSEYKKEAD